MTCSLPKRTEARVAATVVFCAVLFGAGPAFADMPFVFIFILAPLGAIWATVIGVLIEWLFVWRSLGLPAKRAIKGVIVANVASILVGMFILLPIGLPIEAILRRELANLETVTALTIGLSVGVVLVAVINTAIELPILFGYGVRKQWRSAWILYLANVLSLAVLVLGPFLWNAAMWALEPEEPKRLMHMEGTARDLKPDCNGCPEMVAVPGGRFTMGSGKEERRMWDQSPLHLVSIRPFALGKYEVTQHEWNQCVSEGGCRHKAWKTASEGKGPGLGRCPAFGVTWREAKSYVRWLSKKTGKKYRLPSEAEWEYAARAGLKPRAPGAGRPLGSAASGATKPVLCGESFLLRVGSSAPNGLGLYEIYRNAAEWVEDCYHSNYKGAPDDGSAWLDWWGAGCGWTVVAGRRVIRGDFISTSHTDEGRAVNRSHRRRTIYQVGFRVARDLG